MPQTGDIRFLFFPSAGGAVIHHAAPYILLQNTGTQDPPTEILIYWLKVEFRITYFFFTEI